MGLVHCRICGQEINRDKEDGWMNPSRNYFYHTSCYETWAKKKNDIHSEADEKLWKDAVYDYLQREVKISVDYPKFNNQWSSFVKKGRTPKGIYFTVRYFYEVLKGEKDKAQGGIGIVDYIYEEACEYWCKKETRDSGIVARIEEQMRAEQAREVKVVRQAQKRKRKTPTFEDIERIGG